MRTLIVALSLSAVAAQAQELRFHAVAGDRVARVPRDSVRNANGSVRVWSTSNWAFLMDSIAPRLERDAADERLAIAPGFLMALLIKESAGDSLAVSTVPALGLAQLTATTDLDMRRMVTEWHFEWMGPEVRAWPRSPYVHHDTLDRAEIDALLRRGTITSRTEYLFAPRRAARAAAFWVRLLENKWSTDFWPGGYGSFARGKLNGGQPLTESQLIDLVTVCYNRGYIRVHDLVARYGAAWTSHLGALGADSAEARDYLERVRAYTALFEGAR